MRMLDHGVRDISDLVAAPQHQRRRKRIFRSEHGPKSPNLIERRVRVCSAGAGTKIGIDAISAQVRERTLLALTRIIEVAREHLERTRAVMRNLPRIGHADA